jgi:hypothetical protein
MELFEPPHSPNAKTKRIDVFACFAATKSDFDAELTAIADEFLGGAVLGKTGNLLLAPLKGPDRTIAKVISDYEGDPSQMKDILRATLIAPTLEQARAVVDAIKARFQTTGKERDLLREDVDATPFGGYRDAKFNIAINGIVAEVQVNVPELIQAKGKGGGHDLYAQIEAIRRAAKGRALTATEEADIARLNGDMLAVYDRAWAAFRERASATSARNSSTETGAPLRIAEPGSNTRGGSRSQAAEEGTTPGTLPSETGTPSTSSSVTPGGNVAGTSTTGNTSTREVGTSARECQFEANIKLVTRDRAAKVLAELKKMLNNRINSGVDPEVFAPGAE